MEIMKRQLFLLRHAKSAWDDLSIPDHDRPLNKRGRKAAATMRRFIRHAGISPDRVWASSARRSLQTLEALEPWDQPTRIEIKEALYHAPAQEILELTRGLPESSRSALLIGHNPGMQEFAILLGRGSEGALFRRMAEAFPTGAIAEFEVDCPWSLMKEGSGRLTNFVTPRELKPHP
jgi:phosphohistidine phosphatase